MSQWHALELGDLLTADSTLSALRAALADRPTGAIYARRTAGDLHCEVTVYFSPAASPLAQRFGARPCAAPGMRGLERLAGEGDGGLLPAP